MRGGRYTYSNVTRWSWKAGIKILDMDMIFVPIHVGDNHWCMACINFSCKRFEYYDSLGGQNDECLASLRQYVIDEAKTHSDMEIDLSEWNNYTARPIPQQGNFYDCGVFACKFADYLSEGLPLVFSQTDMPYFRRRIVLEILNKQYLHD